MRYLLMFAALLLFNTTAIAECLGSQEFSTCTDGGGNSYTISRTGDIIIIQPKSRKTFAPPKKIGALLARELIRKGRLANGNTLSKTFNSADSKLPHHLPKEP